MSQISLLDPEGKLNRGPGRPSDVKKALKEEVVCHGVYNRPGGDFDVDDQSNKGLVSLQRTYERKLEDLRDGLTYVPDEATRKRLERRAEVELAVVEAEMWRRIDLGKYWRAVERGGTDSTVEFFNQFYEDGGYQRFHAGEGTPPSYALAIILDWRQFQWLGKSAIDWAASGYERFFPRDVRQRAVAAT